MLFWDSDKSPTHHPPSPPLPPTGLWTRELLCWPLLDSNDYALTSGFVVIAWMHRREIAEHPRRLRVSEPALMKTSHWYNHPKLHWRPYDFPQLYPKSDALQQTAGVFRSAAALPEPYIPYMCGNLSFFPLRPSPPPTPPFSQPSVYFLLSPGPI